ncbi:MAG: hypothetical protein EBS01_08935 [Verrucomicrobia bacterium]|nr:hypothetical protein [Verrucomicrobiota bacterium]
MTLSTVLCIAVALVVLAMIIRAVRKATGLLLVILGIFACFTGIGFLVGAPLVFVGGVLLFI